MKNIKTQLGNKKKGSVILMTIVLSMMLVLLTYSMMLILTQQIKYSSLSRESLKALAAADSAIECAVYWDFEHPGVDRTVYTNITDDFVNVYQKIKTSEFCAGMVLNPVGMLVEPTINNLNATDIPWHFIGDGVESTFTFVTTAWSVNNALFNLSNPCAVVSVHRDDYFMDVTVTGYNNCSPGAQRRVSRSVYIEY